MNWLNLDLADLRKSEFVGADLAQRGVWLSVISWCAAVENGGKVAGGRLWSTKMWQQACGVGLRELRQPSNLWAWDGDDLVIWNYPNGKENQVKAGRSSGCKGGRPKNDNPPDNPSDNPSTTPTENPKGRERKGIGMEGEGNGRGSPPAPDFPDGFPESPDRAVAMIASVRPEIAEGWVRQVWTSMAAVGCKDAAGRLITNWAHYIVGRWPKDGQRWVFEQGGIEKNKNGDAGGPRFKTPVWPWRMVARRLLGWVYPPEVEWVDIDLESRRGMKAAWDGMTQDQQSEFLQEVQE